MSTSEINEGLLTGAGHGAGIRETVSNSTGYFRGLWIGLFPGDPAKEAAEAKKKAERIAKLDAAIKQRLGIKEGE